MRFLEIRIKIVKGSNKFMDHNTGYRESCLNFHDQVFERVLSRNFAFSNKVQNIQGVNG